MEIVTSYTPGNPSFYKENEKFEISVNYKNVEMPKELFAGMSREEIESYIRLNAEFNKGSEDLETSRLMDFVEEKGFEKTIIENTVINLPKATVESVAMKAEAKEMMKEADAMVRLVEMEIEQAAKELKRGRVNIYIHAEDCYIFPVADRLFYYSFVAGKMLLVKVEKLSDEQMQKWYNTMSKNNDLAAAGFFTQYAEELANFKKAI